MRFDRFTQNGVVPLDGHTHRFPITLPALVLPSMSVNRKATVPEGMGRASTDRANSDTKGLPRQQVRAFFHFRPTFVILSPLLVILEVA